VEKRMFVVREGEEKVWWREEAGDSLFGVMPELLARGKKECLLYERGRERCGGERKQAILCLV
jgi:hypothetical protein